MWNMPIGKTEFFYQNPDAPVPNQPVGVGVLALIHNSGSLLLEQRSDCGRWGLIGGSMEMHETPTEALRREVLEETNLVVTHETLICVAADPSRIVRYPDGNTIRVISFVFEASVEDFSTLNRSDESLDLRFFEEEELAEADIVETARPLIERYLETGARGDVLMEGRD
jgi:8-oxo-dGTP pyrophosphatase MutT (NUDIX family)